MPRALHLLTIVVRQAPLLPDGAVNASNVALLAFGFLDHRQMVIAQLNGPHPRTSFLRQFERVRSIFAGVVS